MPRNRYSVPRPNRSRPSATLPPTAGVSCKLLPPRRNPEVQLVVAGPSARALHFACEEPSLRNLDPNDRRSIADQTMGVCGSNPDVCRVRRLNPIAHERIQLTLTRGMAENLREYIRSARNGSGTTLGQDGAIVPLFNALREVLNATPQAPITATPVPSAPNPSVANRPATLAEAHILDRSEHRGRHSVGRYRPCYQYQGECRWDYRARNQAERNQAEREHWERDR